MQNPRKLRKVIGLKELCALADSNYFDLTLPDGTEFRVRLAEYIRFKIIDIRDADGNILDKDMEIAMGIPKSMMN